MSQKDLLKNQVIEEILRERSNYYIAQRKTLDFWLLISPSFIKLLGLENKIKQTNFIRSQNLTIKYCAIVTTNKEFMNWVKLRLGYFEDITKNEFEMIDLSYKSDGVFGVINLNGKDVLTRSFFSSKKDDIESEITSEKYKRSIDTLM
jgi:hypothetical protein